MSRVFYEFATPSGTSWTHRVSCDLCRETVERVGGLPSHEGGKGPTFAPRALVGWASYSQRVAPSDPMMLSQPEDTWPRLDRDLCPSCAKVVHDLFSQMGVQIATEETRYLDEEGRKIGGQSTFGVELCGEDTGDHRLMCFREAKHEGAHSPSPVDGIFVCPVCVDNRVRCMVADPPSSRWPGLFGFTAEQLAAHAAEQHAVAYEEGPPAGWVTLLEHPRVAYASVASALGAELKLLHSTRRVWSHHCARADPAARMVRLPFGVSCVCGVSAR